MPAAAKIIKKVVSGLAKTPQETQAELQNMPLGVPMPIPQSSKTPTADAGTFRTDIRGGKEVYMVGSKEVSPEEYRNLKKAYMGGGLTGSGEQMLGGYGVEPFAGQIAKQEQIQQVMQEEQPMRRDLSPEARFGEKIPVIGGATSALQNVMSDTLKKIPFLKNLVGEGILEPEILRNAALTEIEERVYQEGITASEKFGAFVEGIPIVGSLVNKYARDLIETPTGNVDTILRNIKQERARGTKYETWARTGVLDPAVAAQNIEDIGLNIQELESRIKLLINFSPSLRFNSDEVNRIETEILRTREILLESKLRAIQANPMTPEDYQLLSALSSFE
jgi:hypothetical protein